MKYSRVHLESIAYELPANVVTSESLEARLAPLYEKLRLRRGQLEALTGIHERREWLRGFHPSDGAILAARKALAQSGVSPSQIGMVVYCGVCRDNFEPATACAVAAAVGLAGDIEVSDISNACLGAMNGIINAANRIELGQIRAALVVSCETSREIVDVMIDEMNRAPDMEMFKASMATLTGGSGAVAMVLADASLAANKPRLLGGAMRSAPEHFALCRWGADQRPGGTAEQYFETDAISVLKHGVGLGMDTWRAFLAELNWTSETIDRVILHQVGSGNRAAILQAIGVSEEKEFPTFQFLGNMGTVALPVAAAIAAERGFLEPGNRVGFLGIGSGLNCLMLGWEWK